VCSRPPAGSEVPEPKDLRGENGTLEVDLTYRNVLDHGRVHYCLNTGTGKGKPARDLSINFVPVAFPDYKPATITVKPGEYELWHVVNAAAVTYLDLQMAQGGAPQAMASFRSMACRLRKTAPSPIVSSGRDTCSLHLGVA
jgi:hypothetical protein